MTGPPTILFDDPHILAVAKPAGLPTQPTPSGGPSLEGVVRRLLAPNAYLGTVHRLDSPVSGVILWAKTPKAARRLSAQFAARGVVKEYWAVVEAGATAGPTPEGLWDDWLARSTDASGVVRLLQTGDPLGRRAVTRYRRAGGGNVPDGTLWLKLWPETGRTHQLRVQASSRGLPIWGDSVYGAARPFAEGVALHARMLTFEHPVSRREVRLVAPVPADWIGQGIDIPGDAAAG